MALNSYVIPYGVRDIKVAPITFPAGVETVGAYVDLPSGRTLTFHETGSTEELRGDDVVVARHALAPTVTWSLEEGGIGLAALAVLIGGSVQNSGASPAGKNLFARLSTDNRPYFKIEGQAISDNGGDLHVVIYKAKVDGDIGGDFADGSFFLTSCSGVGIGDKDNKLYDIVQNETAIAIS